jgi:hypothetical protein
MLVLIRRLRAAHALATAGPVQAFGERRDGGSENRMVKFIFVGGGEQVL